MLQMFPPNNTAKELLLWSIAQGKLATPRKVHHLRSFRRENFVKRKHSFEQSAPGKVV